MSQAFVITLREGLEAFLVVAAAVAFLRHTGQQGLVGAIAWAVALSPMTSVTGSTVLSRVTRQSLARAALALAAAGAVLALGMWMRRVARCPPVDRSAAAAWALFAFALLILTREGLEMVLLLAAIVFQVRAFDLIAGALLGVAVAAAMAWCWAHFAPRLSRPRLTRATAILIVILTVQLVVHGFLDLTEANVLPASASLYEWLEPWGPDGRFGQHVSYLLLLAPVTWLGVAIFFGDGKASHGGVAHVDR
jgi:high-affinity iron transporter